MAGDDEGPGVEGVRVASYGSVLTWAYALNRDCAVLYRHCTTIIILICETYRKEIYHTYHFVTPPLHSNVALIVVPPVAALDVTSTVREKIDPILVLY